MFNSLIIIKQIREREGSGKKRSYVEKEGICSCFAIYELISTGPLEHIVYFVLFYWHLAVGAGQMGKGGDRAVFRCTLARGERRKGRRDRDRKENEKSEKEKGGGGRRERKYRNVPSLNRTLSADPHKIADYQHAVNVISRVKFLHCFVVLYTK